MIGLLAPAERASRRRQIVRSRTEKLRHGLARSSRRIGYAMLIISPKSKVRWMRAGHFRERLARVGFARRLGRDTR
jgi:hypothetical protein